MTKTEVEKLTTQNIIDAIRFAGVLFDSIAANTYHHRTSAIKADAGYCVNLSRKQYYERLAKLIKAGLVKRQNGGYVLTTFGNVIYDIDLEIREAVNSHLKSNNTIVGN